MDDDGTVAVVEPGEQVGQAADACGPAAAGAVVLLRCAGFSSMCAARLVFTVAVWAVMTSMTTVRLTVVLSRAPAACRSTARG